jgi:hypothetical protein
MIASAHRVQRLRDGGLRRSTWENIMSTIALCAMLLASAGDGDGETKRTRTIEEINDLNANKDDNDDTDANATAADAAADDAMKQRMKDARATSSDANDRIVDRLNIDGWPAASRTAASDMVSRYGEPSETTDDKLIWKDVGTFKKIMVSREGDAHRFPTPHTDVLTYVIDYKVPPSRFDDLAYFDGSVHADRTKGELSARCDRHEMNIAALNLADDIIRGQRSVAEARRILTSTQRQVQRDNAPAIARRLHFDATRSATADPDRPLNRAMGR